MSGEVDISVPASLIGEPARAKLLMALADGRALPVGTLAGEAGIATSTCSEHLSKLLHAGLVTVESHGRNRYYRISGPGVMDAVEALARIAPQAPIRSLRQGTRAHALRRGRLCYDHLAGRVGVAVMGALIGSGAIVGGDGTHHPDSAPTDRLSAPGHDVIYALTDHGEALLTDFGLDLDALRARRRPFIRYCMDWTEQAHHLAGGLGAAIATRTFDLGWIRHAATRRAVRVTDEGRRGLEATFGVTIDADGEPVVNMLAAAH